MMIGIMVIALVALGGVMIVTSSSGDTREDRPPRHSAGLTPAQARALKKEGLGEMRQGRQYLSAAGHPGDPGEQENLRKALTHLRKAQECFSRATTVLTGDMDLQSLAERCGVMHYTAQKRITMDLH